ncbi:VOC family protein [Loktanella sp. S4079]|uniref:VOC family protein n=1 Tax=Loktanella sp. S4079 TaxID=579483 RepID=UPI0005F9F032|nr:VOC family protein [Loktanella sp. S4079]KJZ20951.1 glyoxalase [Loktanella sp. S4079]
MVKVLGIGGLFFRSNDPSALAQWYEEHLGIAPAPSDAAMEPWKTDEGVTIFAPFDAKTDYFPQDHAFMLNFRVADLDAACAELQSSGIAVGEKMVMEGVGKFARIHDPEGNPIELWQPA